MYKNTYYRNNSADTQYIIEKEKINQINSLNKDKNISNKKLIDVSHVVKLKLKC